MDVENTVRAAVLDHFDVERAQVDSASVTFLGLEPVEILRIPGDGAVHYATVGGSRHPMGDPTDLLADPVRYLSVTPVTATEAAWVRVRGAQALRDAWAEAGIDVRDPERGAVNL
ncbi:suppressor of fused domain protein [Nocardia salmonicida]